MPVDEKIIVQGKFTRETGYDCTKRLMQLANPPDAIFCSDDQIALGAMRALSGLGLKIPNDVAVVGFDNAIISSHPRIQLTTVSQDVQQMAEFCTRFIINRIEGKVESFQQLVLEPRLMIRRTCGYRP